VRFLGARCRGLGKGVLLILEGSVLCFFSPKSGNKSFRLSIEGSGQLAESPKHSGHRALASIVIIASRQTHRSPLKRPVFNLTHRVPKSCASRPRGMKCNKCAARYEHGLPGVAFPVVPVLRQSDDRQPRTGGSNRRITNGTSGSGFAGASVVYA
jgi:hypothetical protein